MAGFTKPNNCQYAFWTSGMSLGLADGCCLDGNCGFGFSLQGQVSLVFSSESKSWQSYTREMVYRQHLLYLSVQSSLMRSACLCICLSRCYAAGQLAPCVICRHTTIEISQNFVKRGIRSTAFSYRSFVAFHRVTWSQEFFRCLQNQPEFDRPTSKSETQNIQRPEKPSSNTFQ